MPAARPWGTAPWRGDDSRCDCGVERRRGRHGLCRRFLSAALQPPSLLLARFYLKLEDGRHVPVKQMVDADRYLDLIQNRAMFGTDAESFRDVTDAVYELWSGPAALSPDSQKALGAIRCLLASATAGGYSPHRALAVAERSVKSIFIHQFMDPETFDLSRARKCCQVYPQLDGRSIPVCVHNCLKRDSS
jgi:uncharacterized radical SAM superfamily Fe-S cluster-containing enzyme